MKTGSKVGTYAYRHNHLCVDCITGNHRNCKGIAVKKIGVFDCDCVCWEIDCIHPSPASEIGSLPVSRMPLPQVLSSPIAILMRGSRSIPLMR